MSIHCPNCGHESDDQNANFCEYCGARLPRPFDSANSNFDSDFEYGFDSQNSNCQNQSGNSANYQSNYRQPYAPFAHDVVQDAYCIRTKYEPITLNKWNKQNFGWSVFMLIVGIFMLISLTSLDAILKGEQIEGYLVDVTMYPWNVVIILSVFESVCIMVFFASAMAVMCFTAKMKKIKFPTTDERVFVWAKKLQIPSIIALLASIAYTIFAFVDTALTLEIYLDLLTREGTIQVSSLSSGLLFNILLVAGSAVCLRNAKKIATSAQK